MQIADPRRNPPAPEPVMPPDIDHDAKRACGHRLSCLCGMIPVKDEPTWEEIEALIETFYKQHGAIWTATLRRVWADKLTP